MGGLGERGTGTGPTRRDPYGGDVGVYYTEYQSAAAENPDSIDAYSATGNAHSVTVGRIAYLLGLRGPAVAVDTACSSSLVSVHLASPAKACACGRATWHWLVASA